MAAAGGPAMREEIVGRLLRRHATAAVLFRDAAAERLGLGPTDHTCLDLLRERGTMIGRELAALTGLTSGAVTGVVARLERAGYVRRGPDPRDGRARRLSPVAERARDVDSVFGPVRVDAATLLHGFDDAQLAAIAEFLSRATELAYRRTATLRAQAALAPRAEAPSAPSAARPAAPVGARRRSR